MKPIFTTLCCILSGMASAQTARDSIVEYDLYDTLRLIVHFAKDSYRLSNEEQAQTRDFLKDNWSSRKVSVTVSGHTDSDASEAYNDRLSANRCASVVALIDEQKAPFEGMEVMPRGEHALLKEEKTPADQALNRRVELTIVTVRKERKVVSCGGFNPCPKDTVFLPQGTFYIVDTCWRHVHPDCISITEYLTPESARQAGLRTEDVNGGGLISAGMLKYELCEDTKVEVYIPLREDCDGGDMYLYRQDKNGRWRLVNPNKLEVRKINGRSYYPVGLSGSGNINCDHLNWLQPRRTPKVVFKAKDRLKLEEVVWSCDCPFTIQTGRPKRTSGKKIKVDRTCCPELQVSITVKDREGQAHTLPFGDIGRLQHARTPFGCKTANRRRWFIFNIREKIIYRRYKVRRADFS